MTTVFTQFVRHMEPDEPEPTPEIFDQVWDCLRGQLVGELKRRGSWTRPPRYFGIVGQPTWVHHDPPSDALDELTARCFEYVFIHRRASLRDQVREKPSIDGLVTLAIRHFLLEAQKSGDPIGFRIYDLLRQVVKSALEEDQLQLVAGTAKIGNDTYLSTSFQMTLTNLEPADPSVLVERWTRERLDALVAATYRARNQLVGALSEELVGWLARETDLLRFGDLVAPLQRSVRAAWSARLIHHEPSTDELSPVSADVRHRLEALNRCMESAVARHEGKRRGKIYLERLWQFFLSLANEDEVATLSSDDRPSDRQLAELLDVPRGRIPELMKHLQEMVRTCRRASESPRKAGDMASTSDKTPKEAAFALARSMRKRVALPSGPSEPGPWTAPEVGDILSIPGTGEAGVAWLVIGVSNTRARCVAVDTFPFLGTDDVMIKETAAETPWVVRGKWKAELAEPEWTRAKRIDRLLASALGIAREVDRGMPAEPSEQDLPRLEVASPEYQDWIELGPAAAFERLSQQRRFRRSQAPTSSQWPLWLAAALILTVAGLLLRIERMSGTLSELEQPILNLEYREILLTPEVRGEQLLELPATGTHVEIGVALERVPDAERIRIELLDAKGRLVYSSPEMEPRISYSITFPIRRLKRDDPRTIQLLGTRDEETTLLKEQAVRILETDLDSR